MGGERSKRAREKWHRQKAGRTKKDKGKEPPKQTTLLQKEREKNYFADLYVNKFAILDEMIS